MQDICSIRHLSCKIQRRSSNYKWRAYSRKATPAESKTGKYRDYNRVYIGIMEKKMETIGSIGFI